MKAVEGALMSVSVQGIVSMATDGKCPLTTAILLRSFPSCREDQLSIDNCIYKTDRNMVEHFVKLMSEKGRNGDPFESNKLKEIYRRMEYKCFFLHV